MQVVDARRPVRHDTFDLREQIQSDDHSHLHAHADAASGHYSTDDEEHSVLEDDSDGEEHEEYMDDDDDRSSSLSIPNESIDFDLVYSLHSFAATVEGQANVVKGDSLFLMDDSNSYWWLVRVLKTQEVGYIPAENIETPFERLARLNKHRNVDLASATSAELEAEVLASQDRLRNNLNSRAGSNQTNSPAPRTGTRSSHNRGVAFTPALSVHRYPPAVWNEDEEEDEDVEWDDEGYEDEDQGLADEQMAQRRAEEIGPSMEPDDGMSWDDSAAETMQAQHVQQQQAPQTQQQQVQQQRQRELLAQQQQLQQQAQQQQSLRSSSSRERLADAAKRVDPAEVTETRKLTVTPTIAREYDEPGPLLPSAVMEKQQEEDRAKRQRDEETDESTRKKAKGKEKMPPPISSNSLAAAAAKPNGGAKLKKDPQSKEQDDENGRDKKKKGSMFGSLFGRKREKGKEKNGSIGSLESGEITGGRGSEESSRSGHRPSTAENAIPPTVISIQPQQPTRPIEAKRNVDFEQLQEQHNTQRSPPPQVSQHASQLRQRDQQQQALYQQYLNRSPSSPPEAQPSYGLQSASAIMQSVHSSPGSVGSGAALGPPATRPRPGSLILTSTSMDGGAGVPDLSVIRVFAGQRLQTEATFKTVLLNSSTTSADLVRQAIQRFRLPAGENEGDYYLTVKQIEGGASAVLLPAEKPLGVFETLVVEAMELPKVKRSSVGSISSVASNLSMHPAIKKLPMNDFTDDSAVKFYLNRRGDGGIDDSQNGHEGDDTLIADTSHSESDIHVTPRQQYLTVSSTPPGSNVTAERFSSPSFKFALQLVIYPDDLPDDMIFHPLTEAIVFKDTLRESSTSPSPGISNAFRKKIFVFPKNVTVAEVIELGLERFGIPEGVVDGGDEVEDKLTKRRSSTRVRYGLFIDAGSQEKELSPSSRVIESFAKPPTFRAAERPSPHNKRRSADSAQILGTPDDVNPDDPIFILRRATSYRNSTSRHRISVALDEIALQHMHRESASSAGSDSGILSLEESKQKQPSRQEIIAAQRAASRANQRAILSAQTNSVRGMDVLLPGNAMLRSSRYESGDRMRYSYVQPDGEIYDISDIVEQEWREVNSPNKRDLLEGVLVKNKDGIGEKLDRVLNKIKNGKQNRDRDRDLASQSSIDSTATSSLRSASPSEYSMDEHAGSEPPQSRSRSVTPGSAGITSKMPNGQKAALPRSHSPASTEEKQSRPGTTTPTGKAGTTRRHPSIASVMSDLSSYATAPLSPSTEKARSVTTPKPQQRRRLIPKDEFGVEYMMAVIECKANISRTALPPLDVVDEMLFGRPIELDTLHPQVRDIYADGYKLLDDMDKDLDEFLQRAIGVF